MSPVVDASDLGIAQMPLEVVMSDGIRWRFDCINDVGIILRERSVFERCREEDDDVDLEQRVLEKMKQVEEEEEDPEKIKEQSRLRRQAIMEKYKKQQEDNIFGMKTSFAKKASKD